MKTKQNTEDTKRLQRIRESIEHCKCSEDSKHCRWITRISTQGGHVSVRDALILLHEYADPTNLGNVDSMLDEFAGRKTELLELAFTKFCSVPDLRNANAGG